MQQGNHYSRAMGILCSVALISVYCVSAMAMQSIQASDTALVSKDSPQDSSQPDHSQPKASVFTGTIVKNGSNLVLRDSSGTIYRLDTPEKAEPFQGKYVTVTGKLEASTNLLHVETIEAIAA